jgi:hypothetical protein
VADSEGVEQQAQILHPVADVVVQVGRGGADAGPVEPDQSQVRVFGVDACLDRDLPTGSRRAVHPDDRFPVRVAVLGEAEAPAVSDGDAAFERWTLDVGRGGSGTSEGGKHPLSVGPATARRSEKITLPTDRTRSSLWPWL